MQPYLQSFIGCEAPFEEASIVIYGAPYDSTTSFRPGTRFGSSAMRSESFGIETYSPYQDKDLEDYSVCDLGDLELPFSNNERTLAMLAETAGEIYANKKIPLMFGGEHLLSLAPIREAFKLYPDLCVLHLDAHTDLREDYLGEKLSHATVMKRVWDFLGDGRIFQIGIRSGTREEFYWREDHCRVLKSLDAVPSALEEIGERPLYVSLDLDVLDPSELPGTGTPEAGGLRFTELLGIIKQLDGMNVVGMDVMELSPSYDHTGRSTAIACKVARELMLSQLK